MPSNINSYPPGLLSLLGIKALGQYPSVLPDTVQPTIDLNQFYFGYGATFVKEDTDTAQPIGQKGFNIGTAGVGELLIITSGALYFSTLAVGTGITIRPEVYHLATGTRTWAGEAATAAAGQQLLVGFENVVVPPGFRFGYEVTALTGAVVQPCTFGARVLRLVV